VDLADLIPYPGNPNKHSDEQVALLAKIIRARGWRHPVIVSTFSGRVVAGHGRIEAARLLGVATVPVERQAFSSEAEEREFLLSDNRIAELAERDNALLKDLLEQLDTGETDMDLTGYTVEEIERMMTQFHVESTEAPELASGDRAPFRQATFTLHDEQWEEVEAAIAKAKKEGGGESAINENSNGNALAWICGRFNRGA
jgi:ParB-like chromosome segregation protein Spo0J